MQYKLKIEFFTSKLSFKTFVKLTIFIKFHLNKKVNFSNNKKNTLRTTISSFNKYFYERMTNKLKGKIIKLFRRAKIEKFVEKNVKKNKNFRGGRCKNRKILNKNMEKFIYFFMLILIENNYC